MDKRLETLKKILQLSEFVKISIEKNKEKHHHPLKNDLSKSSRRLIFLLLNDGPLNQRTISKILNVSPQAISECVKKLEAENFIIKDTSNKNESIIKLTKFGIDEAEMLRCHIQSHSNELFENFNDQELDSMINFINKLINQEEDNV